MNPMIGRTFSRSLSAVDADLAVGRFEHRGQRFQGRGFPRPVRTDKAVDGSCGNFERQIADGDGFFVVHSKIFDLDECLGHRLSYLTKSKESVKLFRPKTCVKVSNAMEGGNGHPACPDSITG